MKAGWQAFRAGVAVVFRYPPVLASLWAVNLLAALLLVAPPALGLAGSLGNRPALRQAADGLDSWLILETLLAPSINGLLGADGGSDAGPTLQNAFLAGLAALAGLPLLAWLSGAFLSGGLLRIYADAPASFDWRRFLGGGWHWFGSFLLLGLGQGLMSLVGLVMALAAAGAALALGAWLLWLVGAGLLAWLGFWLVLLEYTRACAVAGQTRSPLRAFGRAAAFVFRHPLAVAGLYGPAFLLLGLLHGLYGWVVLPLLPPTWWPLVFLTGQAFILARLAAQAIRLAGVVAQVGPLAGGHPVNAKSADC